jgi:hypothetical protein
MYNKKLLLNVLNDLNKTKAPVKKRDVDYISPDSMNPILGTPQMKKGGSKKFSKHLGATNRLFKKNPLFKKPNYKSKTYDPQAMYFEDGGEPPYNNLPPTYLTALQNFVYPNVKDDPERTGYNSVNNTINYDSQSPIENMDNKWWMEHELFHDLQNQAGGMSTSGVVGQRPNPYAASDESMQGYYDRRDSDVERTIDSMIAQDPNLQFIPRNKLVEGIGPGFIGAENLQYADPTTLEGEARQYEQYIREGNPSIFPNRKYGGSTDDYIELDIPKDQIQKYVDGGYIVEDISVPELNAYAEGGEPCPPGQYWDGKKCVDDPFTKGLISQIKKGNESKKPVPSLTRKAPASPIQNHSASTFPSSAEIKKQKERNKVQTLKEFTIEDQPQWAKDRDKYGVDEISWYESVNPKKWGLNDYSDYSSYNSAFRNAREAGEDEFVYKGERYNTKLIPKEQSDLYWESKDFLKKYYKTQPFIKDNSGVDISNLNNYQKQKYGFTTTELFDRGFDNLSPAENELLTKMMEEENKLLKGELVNDFNINSAVFDQKRKERLQKLDKPTYFSITTQKPKDMEEEGHWNEKKNKMFLNAKNDKLNTNYIHELSHKGDDLYESYESAPQIDMNKFNKQNLRTSGWSQKDFDYISSPSEIESRKLSTLFYLHKNKKPWEAGKISTESLNDLYTNIDNLPFDVRQLLQLYDAQQDDLLNYLNSNYNYEKKKEGGAVNYQLGDEIDEATMKRLKKLGYTFEEI